MGAGYRLSLVLALAALPLCKADAQPLPWPTDQRPAGAAAAAPWPAPGGPVSAPLMSPAPGPVPGFGAPPPPAGQAGAPPGAPPCIIEFTKLREDVEKKGKAAKAASERKVTREEMCKQITVYAAAELKWVKFTEDNVSKCGIPAAIAQQLKTVHGRTEQTREKICTAAPMAPAAPSLSDALGTTRLPTPDTTKTGSGTLDTLTGNALSNR